MKLMCQCTTAVESEKQFEDANVARTHLTPLQQKKGKQHLKQARGTCSIHKCWSDFCFMK